jgi:hypothetical protein
MDIKFAAVSVFEGHGKPGAIVEVIPNAILAVLSTTGSTQSPAITVLAASVCAPIHLS